MVILTYKNKIPPKRGAKNIKVERGCFTTYGRCDLDAYQGRRNFLRNACVSPPCGVLLSPFRDRAPARIPAVTKPIDAATIIKMTMIAADHVLISAMMDDPFILCG
jgi:hypothetical protein